MTERESDNQDLSEREEGFPPVIFDAERAFNTGEIRIRRSRYVIGLPEGEKVISANHTYDLITATIFGLNQALVNAEKGADLRELFEIELAKYNSSRGEKRETYGVWVYYPYNEDLVHFASKELHRLALLACNSSLLMDPERKLDYNQIRNVFDGVVPAIAGLSVGSNIAWSILNDVRPDTIKWSDPAPFKLTNANRVIGLGYQDLVVSGSKIESSKQNISGLREKQEVLTTKVLAQDPFMNVISYKGIDGGNVGQFLGGNGSEPKATVVIDVCDSLDVKLQLAEEARRQRIRLVRFTDAGSTVRVDIRPFDTNPDAPLAYGITDAELKSLFARAGSSEAGYFDFAGGLIGKDHLERGDVFSGLIKGTIPKYYSSVPQLGSTAFMTGGMAGEIIARMALGYKYPERFLVDLENLKFEKWGDLV